jgi:hypothetical protein
MKQLTIDESRSQVPVSAGFIQGDGDLLLFKYPFSALLAQLLGVLTLMIWRCIGLLATIGKTGHALHPGLGTKQAAGVWLFA